MPLQVRAFLDGPRGFLAEGLRTTKVTLPPELSKSFSHLTQGGTARSSKGSLSTRRSAHRKSACGDSVVSATSSLASGGSKVPDGKQPGEEATPDA